MATPNMPNDLDIPIEHTPVLIVGGSMVGMTLSALLASHHVQGCVTVEKHHSTAIHPRAALFHPRTMQIYRELGLYDAMRQEAAKHYDEHASIVNVESLAGRFLGSYMKNLNEVSTHRNLAMPIDLSRASSQYRPQCVCSSRNRCSNLYCAKRSSKRAVIFGSPPN